MDQLTIIITGYIALFVIQTILWAIQLKTNDASTADVGWSIGMALLVGWYAYNLNGYYLREWMLLTPIVIWSARLSTYLMRRIIHDKKEDTRYAQFRSNWKEKSPQKFFMVYQLQPIFNVILSIPFFIAFTNTKASIHLLEWVALIIWIIGLMGETIADEQLNRFKKDKNNEGKICEDGLWSYSRHPNFFFEWVMWIAYAVFAFSSPMGWLGVVSPLFMLVLLMKVTGIPIMEQRALKNKGKAFEEYARKTSFFIPMPRGQLVQKFNLTNISMLLVIVSLFGCSMADIRSSKIKDSGLDEGRISLGRRILQQATWKQDKGSQWDAYDQWTVVVRNVWKAHLVRKLTPIEEKEQRLRWDMIPNSEDVQMTFLEGKNKDVSLGIERGLTYNVDQNQRIYKEDSKIRLYVEPVREYLTWPQELVNAQYVVYDGSEKFNGQEYDKVFVTNGSFEPNLFENQYIAWINKSSGRIEFVQFTLREMLRSYSGVVEYHDYKKVNGINLAHRIRLKDNMGEDKYAHEIIVEEMSFKRNSCAIPMKLTITEYKGSLN